MPSGHILLGMDGESPELLHDCQWLRAREAIRVERCLSGYASSCSVETAPGLHHDLASVGQAHADDGSQVRHRKQPLEGTRPETPRHPRLQVRPNHQYILAEAEMSPSRRRRHGRPG